MPTPLARVRGGRFTAALDLTFDYSPALVAWVKEAFDARWNPKDKSWRVLGVNIEMSSLADELRARGFAIVNADATHYADITPYLTPLASVSPRPDMVAIWPRLYGKNATAGIIGDVGTWMEDDNCWLVPLTEAGRILADPRMTIDGDFPPPAVPDQAPRAQNDPIDCDGTILSLKGVTIPAICATDSVTLEGLEAMGLTNAFDVLHTAPRSYIDRSNPVPISSVKVGEKAVVVARVTSIRKPGPDNPRAPITVNVIDLADNETPIAVKFFRAPWVTRMLSAGTHVLLSGRTDSWNGQWQMPSPLIDVISSDDAADSDARIIGLYPASEKNHVTTWNVRKVAKTAAARLPAIFDPIPASITAARNLPSRTDALRGLHAPDTLDEAQRARDRLAYEELFRWQVTIAMARHAERDHPGHAMNAPGELRRSLDDARPYPLTRAQRRVIDEIVSDMAAPSPMNRLLQGDVGAGKTEVATAALAQAVESGKQAVLMAPLDTLAAQHYEDIARAFEGKARVELLATGVTGKRRKDIVSDIAAGRVDIVVGTSALISEKVSYHDLGLAIIDEQHRFGVEQRAALATKGGAGGHTPDVLVMTATPAPRTAQLTAFGDLDLSIIDEMPPGRQPIATERTDTIPYDRIAAHVANGHQVFVVTPSVTTSKTKHTLGVEELSKTIAGSLDGVRVGYLHGKMKLPERTEALRAFYAHETDVLVATTIIEVGVNVPNATLLVMTGAENFGITQMHQLRGRAGRGRVQGECILTTAKPWDKLNEDTQARIETIVGSTNGFELAQRDLELRGGGSLTGVKQEGQAKDLRVANLLTDLPLIEAARDDAFALVESDPRLARYPLLRAEIEGFIGKEGIEWLATL